MARPTRRLLTVVALIGVAATFACGAAAGDAAKGKKKGAADGAAAAIVGDRSISLAELDEQAAGALAKVRQQEYEVRQQILDGIINEELLKKEAAAKGVDHEALMEGVRSGVADPAQAEIDAFYEQNKARYGTQTKEQVLPQVGTILKSQKVLMAQRAFLEGLRKKYAVKVLLDPPRVQVAEDDDATLGPKSAPITIVAFSDYQCPYCSRAEVIVQQVFDKYGDKVRLVFRDYPLSFHQNAQGAAEGAECAKEQGKFWEMHKSLFANQSKLSPAELVETAAGIGLDKDKFKACLDAGKFRAEVQKDFSDGQSYGVTGTPTYFINGIMLVGAKPLDSFSEVIDQELARRN